MDLSRIISKTDPEWAVLKAQLSTISSQPTSSQSAGNQPVTQPVTQTFGQVIDQAKLSIDQVIDQAKLSIDQLIDQAKKSPMPIEFEIEFAPAAQATFTGIQQSLTALTAIETQIALIAKSLSAPKAVSIRLAIPIRRKKGVIMANYPLNNDEVDTIPILTDDSAGQPVPPPAGDAFTVVSSLPQSLNAAIVALPSGSPAVALNALVAGHVNPASPAVPDLFITVTDSSNLTQFVLVVDIVADTAPSEITLDLANVTKVSQPVPTNPGP